ncbi:4-hydroxythreonine-4-phosphate dehydrogenase PdxA [Leptolyngbya sp. 7M]|uniref:4-hydroxythreonine-4-phosphate dehydrogenase PdxA n=1 Tax=Leptolyngbya sp. 7M TaxID=2812896 RepID=UPI001B8B5075|nr:4-hydroxythreonine-4-phosphate dehydrogenase PdxA [Leptolyngbya sp. 7M]QYO66648.1 4-hydroxythreonine-4-phosphate dehydrogenase PdxA [Leptolyngbya sp. 7M]
MSNTENKERIGITIGDPAGIGPEITLRALSEIKAGHLSQYLVIGDLDFLRKLNENLETGLELAEFSDDLGSSAVQVVDLKNLREPFRIGENSVIAGQAAGQYIHKAVELWRLGRIDAVATAPISKRSLALGGYDFPGHTEFLASLTNTERFAMSFFADNLRVVLNSTHVSLSDAIGLVTKERLVDLINFTDHSLSKLLGGNMKIAVAGLNPHASENGMFGSEESKIILPAIDECRKNGVNVSGPFSPDTVFLRGFRGEFDAVVALYHDQATIAVKSLSFGSGVNVTLGLPLIRTSVDHGTAFDIAGKYCADASSMVAAIRLARELSARKRARAVKKLIR